MVATAIPDSPLSALVDTAAKRGRKARKQSRQAWADFADEAASRASNIVEASKGAQVKPRGKKRRIAGVLALIGALAVVVVAKKKQGAAPTAATANSERTPTRVP